MESPNPTSRFENYWLILQRRWLPATAVFIPVFILVILASLFKKPIYIAEGMLRFQKINTTSSLTGVGTEIGKLEPLVEKSNPLTTESEVVRSLPVVQETINRLQLKDNQGQILKPKDFLKRLTAKDINGSDVLQVSYQHNNPKKAAVIVNTLMTVYLENNISSNRAEARAARKFIEKQLPKAEVSLQQAEAAMREFKEKNKVVALQEEATQAVGVITDLQKQISAANSKIADVNAQSAEIREQLAMDPQQALAQTAVSQAAGVQDLLKEMQKLESDLAAKQNIFQDAHPQIRDLKGKIASLKAILNQRVQQAAGNKKIDPNSNFQLGELKQQLSGQLLQLEATRKGLIQEAAALSSLQTNYKERLNRLPQLEQQQRQLERTLQAAQSTYSLLLQKLQESRIAENQNVGNARMISQAEVPEEPISSPLVSYVSAGLIGIMAAAAAIYLLEVKDKSIKTVDQAKDLFGLTLLGVIPAFGSTAKKSRLRHEDGERHSPKLVVRETPRSPISEAFRMLRANLKFLSADKELKVIVVTSSVPREGKSTVSANLAVAIAQMERKVLLVDADLHRPMQHQIWEIHNHPGLSNVIVEQSDFRTVTKQVMTNLDVLTSGVLPPSPAALLDSKRMAKLIASFAAKYDFVIIDTPSFSVGADAATLGQMADGVLMVVRPGVVDYAKATFAKELLEKSGQNVLGQVVNGFMPQNEPHSYYYFAQEYSPSETDIHESVFKGSE